MPIVGHGNLEPSNKRTLKVAGSNPALTIFAQEMYQHLLLIFIMDSIYLLQHKEIPQYTKIGYSGDLEKRIKQLQTASPTGIKLLFSLETPYAYRIEQALHRRYASKNSNLEWFQLDQTDIDDIIEWVTWQTRDR